MSISRFCGTPVGAIATISSCSCDHLLGRPGRRDESEVDWRKIRKTQLLQCRHVGKQRRAGLRIDRSASRRRCDMRVKFAGRQCDWRGAVSSPVTMSLRARRHADDVGAGRLFQFSKVISSDGEHAVAQVPGLPSTAGQLGQ